MNENFKFSCEINRRIESEKIDIEYIYSTENNKMKNIIENLTSLQQKDVKNSVISVRSYLNRTIGELLNNALYELEIQRERKPDKTELFTAKGSIAFISQFLIDHKV